MMMDAMMNTMMVEELIDQNHISMKTKRMQWNPILGNHSEDMAHYRCRLQKPGRKIEVYLSIDLTDERLSVEDVLLLLAMEASGCKLLEGYEEHRHELTSVFAGNDGNMREIEEFWQEYEVRCKQADELRIFLGDAVYSELLEYFSSEMSLA